MPSDEQATAVVLDECIDALLTGGEWTDRLPAGTRNAELERLVVVGQWLIQLAHRSSGGAGQSRERIWRRVQPPLNPPSIIAWILSALSPPRPALPG